MTTTVVAANDNHHDFYVYAWLRPDGIPFYVGKGQGDRDSNRERNRFFTNVLEKIKLSGGGARVVRWQEGLSEDDAFRLERAYIKLFGRRDNGTGVLVNLTDGGEGCVGRIATEEQREKLRKSATAQFMCPTKKNNHANSMSTPEYREKIRIASINNWSDKAYRSKHAAAMLAVTKKPGYFEERSKIISEVWSRPEFRDKHAAGMAMASQSSGWRDSLIVARRTERTRSTNKSGFKGVSFDMARGKWVAEITINYKKKFIGRFLTAKEAARAYDREANAILGDGNCYLNFGSADKNEDDESCRQAN